MKSWKEKAHLFAKRRGLGWQPAALSVAPDGFFPPVRPAGRRSRPGPGETPSNEGRPLQECGSLVWNQVTPITLHRSFVPDLLSPRLTCSTLGEALCCLHLTHRH